MIDKETRTIADSKYNLRHLSKKHKLNAVLFTTVNEMTKAVYLFPPEKKSLYVVSGALRSREKLVEVLLLYTVQPVLRKHLRDKQKFKNASQSHNSP